MNSKHDLLLHIMSKDILLTKDVLLYLPISLTFSDNKPGDVLQKSKSPKADKKMIQEGGEQEGEAISQSLSMSIRRKGRWQEKPTTHIQKSFEM